jgi:hypothetical protein
MNASAYFERRLRASIAIMQPASDPCALKAHESLANGYRAQSFTGPGHITPDRNAMPFLPGACQHTPNGRPDNPGTCEANGL